MEFISYKRASESMIIATRPDNTAKLVEPFHPEWDECVKEAGPYSPPPEPTPEELLAKERARMECSRAQGKMAIGPEVWTSVVAMADDPETPWGLKVAIYDTYVWKRTDTNMDVLIWAMGLTDEQADDLFRLAMTL